MNKTKSYLYVLLALVALLASCNLPASAPATNSAESVLTAAAQTVEASLTQAAIANPPTAPPAATITGATPTVTLAGSLTTALPNATATQNCCH